MGFSTEIGSEALLLAVFCTKCIHKGFGFCKTKMNYIRCPCLRVKQQKQVSANSFTCLEAKMALFVSEGLKPRSAQWIKTKRLRVYKWLTVTQYLFIFLLKVDPETFKWQLQFSHALCQTAGDLVRYPWWQLPHSYVWALHWVTYILMSFPSGCYVLWGQVPYRWDWDTVGV